MFPQRTLPAFGMRHELSVPVLGPTSPIVLLQSRGVRPAMI